MRSAEQEQGQTMNTQGLMTSGYGAWETPDALFKKLDEEFHFVVDVCALDRNKKCDVFISPVQDSLITQWSVYGKTAWMNPPYGRVIGLWVAKASRERMKGVTTVALLPARTDTRWWHEYIQDQCEVRFIKGRVKFKRPPEDGPMSVSTFPSVIVIFKAKV